MRSGVLGNVLGSACRGKRCTAIALTVVVATTASVGVPLTGSASSPSTAVTREATASSDFRPDRFSFSVAGFQYSITARGLGLRSALGRAPQRFQLRLERGTWIERLSYLPLERDIILVYENADSESGAGIAVRLTGEGLQARWSAHIPSFNIGEAVMERDHLYLTALGFIAKLNLTTGRYAWVHKDLYVDGRFNSFKRPVVGDAVVKFTDGANTITVDKRSGVLVP